MHTAETLREINGAIALLNEVAQGLHQEISRFKVANLTGLSLRQKPYHYRIEAT